MTDRRIEVVARAMYEATVPPDPEWDLEDDYIKNNWRGRAKSVLAALDADWVAHLDDAFDDRSAYEQWRKG